MEITTQVPSAFFMVGDLLLKKRKRKGIKRDFPCGNQADFKTQPTLRNYQLQPDSTFPCIRLGEALFSSIHIPWQPLASHMSWSVPNINKVHPTHRASKHPRFFIRLQDSLLPSLTLLFQNKEPFLHSAQ